MSLSNLVKLYRSAGRPNYNGVFEGLLNFTKENIALIESIKKLQPDSVDELRVDNREIMNDEPIPQNGEKISFLMRPPTNSAERFHLSIESFISSAKSLSQGEMPDEYYIIAEDFYSCEDPKPKKIATLTAICNLIAKLTELAQYHDSKNQSDSYKLIFVQPNDADSGSAIALNTKIKIELLDIDPPQMSLFEELGSENLTTDPRFNERKGVFLVSLTEFVKNEISEQGRFELLVKNWGDFINLYQNNLATYISGFAFHKAKKEVAQEELRVAEQFSKVTSDITGKLLSVPVSFAAVIATYKSDSLLEPIILILGLLIVAVIISGTVRNQQKQFDRIVHAKNLIFKSIEGKEKTYPEDLKEAISNMKREMNSNEKTLKIILWTFRALSWIPVGISLAIFYQKNYEPLGRIMASHIHI